jgi:Fe-S cluster assembly protein SufD
VTTAAALLERLGASASPGRRAERGRAWLARHGLPDDRDEDWTYTPIREVVQVLEASTAAPDRARAVSRSLVDDLAGRHGDVRLVYVNGAFAPDVSDLDPCRGLWVGGTDGLRRREPSPRAREDQPVDGFHALNWAAGRDVAAVFVDQDVEIERPVHVVHLAMPGDGPSASHPRTVVRVGARSRLHLVESFVGLPGESLTNASTRIVATTGSTVTYCRIQDEAADAVHIGRTGIDQADASTVRATSILLGGRIARSAIDVDLAGADARVDLDGLYLPRGRQHHDSALRVDHTASRTTSTQQFRGIVDDHARGSFSGHVIVRPGTERVDAAQSNRNLVLRPTAQVDTRPWLEIFTDDVRCTHGATVGRLDDDALFYLRSRGIPIATARTMLVAAFAAEIVDAIAPSSLRVRLADAVERWVAGAPS